MVTVSFFGVASAFQKVGLGNSIPRCCNRFRLESVWLVEVVTGTNPVAVHLKDINRGEVRVLIKLVKLQVGA